MIDKALFKKVSWCVTKDSRVYRCNLHLHEWLLKVYYYSREKKPDRYFPNAKKLTTIDEKYFIRYEEDKDVLKEILEEYQSDLIQKYFKNELYSNKELTEQEFFLLTLGTFLEKHLCETTFNGKKMYDVKNHKSFGTWGYPTYSATYVLTDYALVYHKMFLITQIYHVALMKQPVGESSLYFRAVQGTKDAIETKTMDVSNI